MTEFGKILSPVNFHIAFWSLLSEIKIFTAEFREEEWMATTDCLVFSLKLNEVMLASKWMKLHGYWLCFCMKAYLLLSEIGE